MFFALLPHLKSRPSSNLCKRVLELPINDIPKGFTSEGLRAAVLTKQGSHHMGIDVPPDGSINLSAAKKTLLLGRIRMPDNTVGVDLKPEAHGWTRWGELKREERPPICHTARGAMTVLTAVAPENNTRADW